jgi:hypothetical protein
MKSRRNRLKGIQHTNVAVGGREMQHARSSASLALVLDVDSRCDNLSLGAAILRGKTGDIGLQGLQITCAGIVDEVIDRLGGECNGHGRLGL